MSFQNVTCSNKQNGTSFSGVLPTIYEMPWQKRNDNNASKINYEKLHSSKGTTGIGVLDTFLIFSSRDTTTANVILNCSAKDITRYWQHEQLPEIRKKISDQFYAIRQRQDNWDERGSKKPNELSISKAEGIISDLLISIIESGYLWLTPHISSDEEGNISIEWHKGQHELHIEAGDNEAEYIKVWGTNIESEMHVDFLDKENYLTLWDWLLHGWG